MEAQLMRTAEVIKMTGLSRSMVYRWLENKEVPEHCVAQAGKGHAYLFLRRAVEFFCVHARWPEKGELDGSVGPSTTQRGRKTRHAA